MADDTMPVRLIRGLRLRGAARPRPDFADYGTAFGLEMSLEPDPPPREPAPAQGRDPGWWARFGQRRRPARP